MGRSADIIVSPSGKLLHGEFFTHLMYGSHGISMFQFHQLAPDSILLWIVPGPGDPTARELSIRAAVEQVKQLDPGMKVEARLTEAIPLSKGGKHRFVRSDLQTRPAGWE